MLCAIEFQIRNNIMNQKANKRCGTTHKFSVGATALPCVAQQRSISAPVNASHAFSKSTHTSALRVYSTHISRKERLFSVSPGGEGGGQGAVRAASWREDIGPVGNRSRRGHIRGTAHSLRTLQHDYKFRSWVAKVMKQLFNFRKIFSLFLNSPKDAPFPEGLQYRVDTWSGRSKPLI